MKFLMILWNYRSIEREGGRRGGGRGGGETEWIIRILIRPLKGP